MANKAAKLEKRGKTILRIRQSHFGVPIVEQSVDLRVLDVKQTTWRNFLNQEKSAELDEKLAEGDWKVVSPYRKMQASLDDPVAFMLEQCDRKRTLSVLLRKGVPPQTRLKKPKSKSKKANVKAVKAVKSEPEEHSTFVPAAESGAPSLPSPFQKYQENYGYQNNKNGAGAMLEECNSTSQLENYWDYKPEVDVSEPVCKLFMTSSCSGPEFNIKTQTQDMSSSPLGLGQTSAPQAIEMYQSDPAIIRPELPEERHVEMNDDMWSEEAWSQGTVGVSEVSTASSELQYLVGTSIWQELRKMAPALCQWVEWFLLTTSDPDSPNPAVVPLP